MMHKEIDPDEIFLDSKNLPEFDIHQFEGRLEKPINRRAHLVFGGVLLLVILLFFAKLWDLQVVHGESFKERSENNKLRQSLLFAPRGIIRSREGERLAWNEATSSSEALSEREYIDRSGFGPLLGFIKYPAKDSSGFFYEEEFIPKDGAELYFNESLSGKNGLRLSEVSVRNEIISESIVEPPSQGENITLSIDAGVQAELYKSISELANSVGFQGGAGIIMDVNSGEILAMTSFPEYSPKVMTEGKDKSSIASYATNPNNPFLNRVLSGLYTPGSIVKPFLAFAALEEGIISPEKEIVSTGKLVVPNPYNPDNPSVFRDWKAHGAVNMRRAIAVSSDVYFYQIGGGFGSQKGLGIDRIKKYLETFGLSQKTGFDDSKEVEGIIPDPKWKEETFDGEVWRVGDTYNTAIGQYGMQITPIQAVRAVAAMANGGYLVTPSLLFTATNTPQTGTKINGDPAHFQIAREGMRMSVQEGTALGLNTKAVAIGGKTGTAELGARKQFVNSWSMGFFPYEKPKYAFIVVMERGPVKNLVGATAVMRRVVDWMAANTPQYFKNE